VTQAEYARHRSGTVVSATLTARPVTLDLGGPTVDTWAYAQSLPGPALRAKSADLLRVEFVNDLPGSL